MCMFSAPDMPMPQQPKETAAMRMPDGNTVRSTAGRRAEDRLRSGSNTILTSGSGVLQSAATDKKTLLGQ